MSTAATARNELSVDEKSAGADRIVVFTSERPIDIGANLETAPTNVKPHGMEIDVGDAREV